MASKTGVVVTGLDDMFGNIEKASVRTKRNVSNALEKFAFLVHREAIKKIQKGTRSGAEYSRGASSRRRSAAGEPPKTDTGRLVSAHRVVAHSPFNYEVGALENIAPYADQLEDKHQMNRPWLEPTLKENQSQLGILISQAISKGGLV